MMTKKMSTFKLLLPLLFLVLSALLPFTFSGPLTAYQLLESHNLPKGLLPVGVESYLLQSDGNFDVYFGGECQFKIQNKYLLRYKRRISGKLEDGEVKDLKGVSVKVLFLWLGIGDVVRSGDEMRFYVGPISVSFPVDAFKDCPRCRCGFDCGGEDLVGGLLGSS